MACMFQWVYWVMSVEMSGPRLIGRICSAQIPFIRRCWEAGVLSRKREEAPPEEVLVPQPGDVCKRNRRSMQRHTERKPSRLGGREREGKIQWAKAKSLCVVQGVLGKKLQLQSEGMIQVGIAKRPTQMMNWKLGRVPAGAKLKSMQ